MKAKIVVTAAIRKMQSFRFSRKPAPAMGILSQKFEYENACLNGVVL
jgi:hypothetical protein